MLDAHTCTPSIQKSQDIRSYSFARTKIIRNIATPRRATYSSRAHLAHPAAKGTRAAVTFPLAFRGSVTSLDHGTVGSKLYLVVLEKFPLSFLGSALGSEYGKYNTQCHSEAEVNSHILQSTFSLLLCNCYHRVHHFERAHFTQERGLTHRQSFGQSALDLGSGKQNPIEFLLRASVTVYD